MNWKRELRRLSYKYRSCIANDTWDLPNPNTLSEDDKIKFCIDSILKRDESQGKLFERIVKENNVTYSNLIDFLV